MKLKSVLGAFYTVWPGTDRAYSPAAFNDMGPLKQEVGLHESSLSSSLFIAWARIL